MDASKVLSILYSEIHSVVVGMIDSEGHPSSTFVKDDETWHKRNSAYQEFLKQAIAQRPVFLELGVGFNTPGIIRYPFERIAAANPDAMLIRVNQENAEASYTDLNNILSIQQDLKAAVDNIKHS
jgi:hypothetical protein